MRNHKSSGPRFAQHICRSEVCLRNPRIAAQKLRSEVCTAKSSDGLNPYFTHNIYICVCV